MMKGSYFIKKNLKVVFTLGLVVIEADSAPNKHLTNSDKALYFGLASITFRVPERHQSALAHICEHRIL